MGASSAMAPLLNRNLITTIFIFADKSLHNISTHSNIIRFIRRLLTSSFLYFLAVIPGLVPSSSSSSFDPKPQSLRTPKHDVVSRGATDSGIARALSQLLAILNDIPVSSRKYEVVRSLAETIIDENNSEGFQSLRDVNRKVLSAAFERTLRRLDDAALAEERGDLGLGALQSDFYYLGRALKALRYLGDAAWATVVRPTYEVAEPGGLTEKLAAEVLWLAQKLEACGYVEEAVSQWACASRLAWLSLRVDPRLQGSLVKVSAFLLKHARDGGETLDENQKMKHKQIIIKLLISWLPVLCRASNGIDAPVLSTSERAELERILEEKIDVLGCMEDQEKVLSVWLHHFTYSPSTDWPNLRECYARWCAESRKQLMIN